MIDRHTPSLLISLLFIFFGTLPFVQIWGHIAETRAAAGWPAVEGRVVHSDVQSVESGLGWHYPDVRCEYQVGDKAFTNLCARESGQANGRVTLANAHYFSREKARKTAEKYPVGATVKVFYPPDRPQDGILEPGVWSLGFGQYFWLGLGLFGLGLGLFGAVARLTRRKPPGKGII